jgi:hypothetical protein
MIKVESPQKCQTPDPRFRGDLRTKDWIPAFAGMTAFLYYLLSLLLQIPSAAFGRNPIFLFKK